MSLNEGPPGEGQRRLRRVADTHAQEGASTKGRPVKGSDSSHDTRSAVRLSCLNEGPPGEGQRPRSPATPGSPAPRLNEGPPGEGQRPTTGPTPPTPSPSLNEGPPGEGQRRPPSGSARSSSSRLNEGPPGEGQRLHLHSSMPDQQKRPRRREVRISRSESGRFMSRPDHKFPLTRDNTSARGRGRPPGRGDLSHQTMKDSREVTTRSRPTHLNDALLPPTGPRSQRSTESLARSKTPVSSP